MSQTRLHPDGSNVLRRAVTPAEPYPPIRRRLDFVRGCTWLAFGLASVAFWGTVAALVYVWVLR